MLAGAATLLGAWIAGQSLALEAGLRTESRAGVAPSATSALVSQGVVELLVAPTAGITVTSPRATLGLRYAPSIFTRFLVGSERPLVAHQGQGRIALRASRVLDLELELSGGVGEVDYTNAAEVFPGPIPGVPPAALPATQVLTFQNIDLAGGARLRTARPLELRLRSGAHYRAPTRLSGIDEGDPGRQFAQELRFELEAGAAYEPSGDDSFDAALTGQHLDFAPPQGGGRETLQQINAHVAWRHRLTRIDELYAGIGATVVVGTGSVDPVPRAELAYRIELVREPSWTFASRAQAELAPYTDVFARTVEPRATMTLELQLAFPLADVGAGLSGSFSTPTRITPRDTDAAGASVDSQTLVQVRAPITWRANEILALELGGRFLARGPRLAADDFDFRRFEAIGYVALTFQLTTASREDERAAPAPTASEPSSAPPEAAPG
ncbi:MAG: hypothetical protein IT384_18140 [Deltaproteobacteria bacterium]|nr:hypothetical protein [Deltaproteobacteria bacterium]